MVELNYGRSGRDQFDCDRCVFRIGSNRSCYWGIRKVCSFVGVPPRCGMVPRVSSCIEQLHRAAASDPPPQSGGSAIRADTGEAHLLTTALVQLAKHFMFSQ